MSTPEERIELAGCLVWNHDKELLLLHRNEAGLAQWELPGGKIEVTDASPAEAAIRETREELGIEVEQIGDKEVDTVEFYQQGKLYRYHWIGARILKGRPRIVEPEHHDEYFYFPECRLRSLRNADLLSPNVELLFDKIAKGKIVPML